MILLAMLTLSLCVPAARPAATLALDQLAFGPPRVAVLIVGQQARFYPRSTMEHVVAPAVRAGYSVDVFVRLTAEASPDVAGDPWKQGWHTGFGAASPEVAHLEPDGLRAFVGELAGFAGARRVDVAVQPRDPPLASLVPSTWTRWLGRDSLEDPELYRRIVRFLQTELLWNATVAAEGPDSYRHVVLTRDDAHWLADLHMELFPDRGAVYSRSRGGLCQRPWPHLPDDRSFVLGGRAAANLLSLYTDYRQNTRAELDGVDNVEDFLITLARLRGIRWEITRQDWFPFVVGLHLRHPRWREPRFCLRGVTRELLERPTGECVEPHLLRHDLCHDLLEYL